MTPLSTPHTWGGAAPTQKKGCVILPHIKVPQERVTAVHSCHPSRWEDRRPVRPGLYCGQLTLTGDRALTQLCYLVSHRTVHLCNSARWHQTVMPKEPDKYFLPHLRDEKLFQVGQWFGELGSCLYIQLEQLRSSKAPSPTHHCLPAVRKLPHSEHQGNIKKLVSPGTLGPTAHTWCSPLGRQRSGLCIYRRC